ncbi:N,N'-diacetyllegionaminic acid synthase [Sporomusa rhizae]|uniref:N-acetylneuraminate synthase family protein n=1 Tax=Sporomusa rhizae TaxID=357999 RepID=UPI00352BCCB5
MFNKTFVIAEIGSNHNRDKAILKELIDVAANAKVDAVKFQTFFYGDIASDIVSATAYGEADYTNKKKTWNNVLENLALPLEWYDYAFEYARSKGIIPFSTPESLEAVDFLESLNVDLYKVASMDLNYTDLLVKVAKTNKPVVFSTGMGKISEVATAYECLKNSGCKEIGILHCLSQYPPKYNEINLQMLKRYQDLFTNATVGFSDHSLGIYTSIAAVAIGAKIIEKHITLDRSMPGPDHCFAMEPIELEDLVKGIRAVEQALQDNERNDFASRKHYRRSLVYVGDLKKGDILKKEDIEFKRPGDGMGLEFTDVLIGLKLTKDVYKGELINSNDFKED